MKLNLIRYLAVIVCFFASINVFASGFSIPMQIIGMDVGDTGSLYLRFNANTECNSPLAHVGNSQTYYKDILSMALLAYSTGKDVNVWVSSCDTQGMAVITRLVIGTVW